MRARAKEHVPRNERSPWFAEHAFRYRAVRTLAVGRVLDVACGAGIGFGYLDGASALIGGDRDADALAEARSAPTAASPVALCRLDAIALPFRDGCFDAITCFETVEHVEDDRRLVEELSRVVRNDGVVVVSTPNVDVTGDRHGRTRNPFHVREYDDTGLRELLRAHFADVEVRGQRPILGSSAFFTPGRRPADVALTILAKASLRAGPRTRAMVNRIGRGAVFPGLEDWQLDEPDGTTHALVAFCRRPFR